MVRCEWRAKTRALGRTPVLTSPCLTSSAKSFLKLSTPIVNSLISQFIFTLRAYSLLFASWISSHGYSLRCVCGGGNPGTFETSPRYEVINVSNLHNMKCTLNWEFALYYSDIFPALHLRLLLPVLQELSHVHPLGRYYTLYMLTAGPVPLSYITVQEYWHSEHGRLWGPSTTTDLIITR